jgi:hypothetical protein
MLKPMHGYPPLRSGALVAGIVVLGLLILPAFSMPTVREKISPDFIQFWTAAKLLSSGHSPYDPALQAAIQQELGWKIESEGLGVYRFLPYYYPPWFGLACVPLLPLGYANAKLVWLVMNTSLLLTAGLLLRNVARGLSPIAVVVFVCLFAPCVLTILMGQVSILVLLPVLIAWRLLDVRRDVAAGAVLAWLTIKPQLTGILLLGVLTWCIRRGRWRAVGGFVGTLTLLVLVSTIVVPSWPLQMTTATQITPLITDLSPWKGVTLFTVLRTIGAHGASLWVCYLAVAVAFIAAVLRLALDRSSQVERVLGVSLIAPFFVAPYGRQYDLVILLIPASILIGGAGGRSPALLLATALLVLPYINLGMYALLSAWLGIPGRPEATFFWMPLLIAGVWLLFAVCRLRDTR